MLTVVSHLGTHYPQDEYLDAAVSTVFIRRVSECCARNHVSSRLKFDRSLIELIYLFQAQRSEEYPVAQLAILWRRRF